MNRLKVIVADPCPLARLGIIASLKNQKGITIAAQAENINQLQRQLNKRRADVIIMEIDFPLSEANQALRLIKKQLPDAKIILLSHIFHEELVSYFMGKGGNAYLHKRACSPKELLTAVEIVQTNKFYSTDDTTSALLTECLKKRATDDTLRSVLSDRQIQVMRLMIKGKKASEIADDLKVSLAAVRSQIVSIRAKTGIDSLGQLTLFALRNGIISLYGEHLGDS